MKNKEINILIIVISIFVGIVCCGAGVLGVGIVFLLIGVILMLASIIRNYQIEKYQEQRIEAIDKTITRIVQDFGIECNPQQKNTIIRDVDLFVRVRVQPIQKVVNESEEKSAAQRYVEAASRYNYVEENHYCMVNDEEDFVRYIMAVTVCYTLGFEQFIYHLQKQNNLEVGWSYRLKRDIFHYIADKIKKDNTLFFDYENKELQEDIVKILNPKIYISYKENSFDKEDPNRSFKDIVISVFKAAENADFLNSSVRRFDFSLFILFEMRIHYMLKLRNPALITKLDSIFLEEIEVNYKREIPNVSAFIDHRLGLYENAWQENRHKDDPFEELRFVLKQCLYKGDDVQSKEICIIPIDQEMQFYMNVTTLEAEILSKQMPELDKVLIALKNEQ